ncbi:hypothetical protein D3C81_759320 [compost metagenome]
MNMNELKPVLAALYNAGIPGMIWGQPGIGKSTILRAVAEQLRDQLGLPGPVLERHEVAQFIAQGGDVRTAFGMFDVRLSQSDPVDIGGLPREDKLTGTMERLPPNWFAHGGRQDLPNFGLLLLDELPTAPLSVQTAAYQIVLDKVIDRYKLKDGWSCFAAGNRVTDGGQYFKMPYALANRFCHLDAESSLDSWVDWAINEGIDHSLIAFVRFKPELLNTFEAHVKEKRKGFSFATERVLEKVNDLLVNNKGLGDDVLSAIAGGLASAGWAAEYLSFRKVWHNMPSVQQVLIDPQSAMLPEDAATQYAICTALAAAVSYNNLNQALDYVDRFTQKGRGEMSMLFIKDMQRRASIAQRKAQEAGDTSYMRPESSPAYTKWVHANQDLFG